MLDALVKTKEIIINLILYKKETVKNTIILLLILAIIIAIVSCAPAEYASSQPSPQTEIPPENLFDAREVSAGDTVSGLEIISLSVEPGPDLNNEENYFAIVKFSGKLKLTGKYISYSDQPLLGRSIIFYPDKESSNLIPRLKHDLSDTVWFVFENYTEAFELLSQPDSEGNATIIVDNFTINYTLEPINTVNIAGVINKKITKNPSQPENTQPLTQETTAFPEPSNLFDARQIKPGDTIMEMTVKTVSITPWQNDDSYSAVVEFEGRVTVPGNFKINKNDEFLGNLVSFIPDEESSAVLPRLSHDTRYSWFVFKNTDKVKDIFSSQGEEGLTTIVIDNYVINYAPSDVYNTAVFMELVARG